MKKLKKSLIEKAESLDWSVNIYDKTEWEFEKWSPAGEDFVFSVIAENPDEVWRKVREYANDFDQEEHIKMWIAASNRTSGVPSVRALVEDAAEIGKMLDELADALQEVIEANN